MNSVEQIVYANAVNVARATAKKKGTPAYVYRDDEGRLNVTIDYEEYNRHTPVYSINDTNPNLVDCIGEGGS